MSEQHFNGLTADQAELFALLLEELREAQQVIGKILRHGLESRNPTIPQSKTNRQMLEDEIGHVQLAVELLCSSGVLDSESVSNSQDLKYWSVWQWMHHNSSVSFSRRAF